MKFEIKIETIVEVSLEHYSNYILSSKKRK